MTKFKILKKPSGKDFVLHIIPDIGETIKIVLSYADIVRMRMVCDDARVRYQ